jgi:hypothetical protein
MRTTMCGSDLWTSPAQAGEQRQRHLQGSCRLLLLQEGTCGPGTTACSNRPLLGFLGILDKGVEFGFEGGGVGGVSQFGAHGDGGGLKAATAGRVWRRRRSEDGGLRAAAA